MAVSFYVIGDESLVLRKLVQLVVAHVGDVAFAFIIV